MRKSWWLLLLIVALAVGGGVFVYAGRAFERLVATQPLVVAAAPLPPYTVITTEHLTVRELPRVLAAEAIYLEPAEVIGKITTGPIPAGALLYRAQLVAPAQFRLAPAELEVVSIPVDPARAVGGQLRIGHTVNLYRVARERRLLGETTLAELLASKGAAAELLVTAPVVDVRDSRGLPTDQRQAASQIEREGQPTPENRPLQIVTLAVPPELATIIVELAVEQSGGEYELWLSLAPPGTPLTTAAPQTHALPATGAPSGAAETAAATQVETRPETENEGAPLASATPAATADFPPAPVTTPEPPALSSTRIVTGTAGNALRLRAAPEETAPVLTTLAAGTVVTLTGVVSATWQQVQVPGFVGWVASAYLDVP